MSDNTPGIWSMAKSFSKDLAKYVKEGAPNVSEQDYRQRLADCNACEHLIKERMRCGKCGCLIQHKAKWKTTTCPINKWKAQVVDSGKIKEGDNTDTSDKV
jgi:hypothetical protein|tara:strand:- start:1336 stop:1638 length:303 start_codon:yes stop_codon:yes gene_type:complete